jgi:pyrimidine operon attenuation protein / uracil phosphoribosyltransferase
MTRSELIKAEASARIIRRMAFEVVERNRGASELTVVGIRRRGSALARTIAFELSLIEGASFPVFDLDTAPFRDDLAGPPPPDESNLDPDVLAARDVLLVDDVLSTGRTIRAALDALVRYGRPRSIQLAVLIDRGGREYPIRPDYVGRTVNTSREARIVVDPEASFSVFLEL